MNGALRFGMMVVAGSLLLPLAACARTSDGTIVGPKPLPLPAVDMEPAKRLVPSWMKRKKPEPVAAENFPTPPVKRSAPRRKAKPPVVSSNSGNLACKKVSESGRVRMVCE